MMTTQANLSLEVNKGRLSVCFDGPKGRKWVDLIEPKLGRGFLPAVLVVLGCRTKVPPEVNELSFDVASHSDGVCLSLGGANLLVPPSGWPVNKFIDSLSQLACRGGGQ